MTRPKRSILLQAALLRGLFLSLSLQHYIINIKNKKDKKTIIIIWLLLFILELKGEVIGFSLIVNSILLMSMNNFELIGDEVNDNCVNDNL